MSYESKMKTWDTALWAYSQATPAKLHVPDMVFQVFKQSLPADVPEARARSVFNHVMDATRHINKNRIEKCGKIYDSFSQNQLKTGNENLLHELEYDFKLLKKNDEKQDLLSELKEKLEDKTQSLDGLKKGIIDLYVKNEEVINRQRNRAHRFFMPKHQTATRKLFDALFVALNARQEEIDSARAPQAPR